MFVRAAVAVAMLLGFAIPDAPPPGVDADVWANYKAIPDHNTDAKKFDAIIVLGVPTKPDGSLSDEEESRMKEGIAEWKRGVAPVIIPTGGKAHNEFTESGAMKRYAVAQGVPADAVIEEDQAKDTIQNIWFSWKIMQAHGWTSAEVVSSPSHLPRTSLILQHYKDMKWRTHAAGWPPDYDQAHRDRLFAGESKGCWTLTHDGFKPNSWLPGS